MSGPLADRAAFALHADYRSSDGFFRNSFLNAKNVDDAEEFNIGGRILFTPRDSSTFDFKARWGRIKEGNGALDTVFSLPTFAQFLNQPLLNENINRHAFAFQSNIRPVERERSAEVSLKWDEELRWARLSTWALYSDLDSSFTSDNLTGVVGTFTTAPSCQSSTAAVSGAGFTLPSPQSISATPESSFFGPFTPTGCDGTHYQVRNRKDASAGVTISSPEEQRLRWHGGFRAATSKLHTGSALGIDTGAGVTRQLFVSVAANPTEQSFDDRGKAEAFAVFAGASYEILPHLDLTADIRYDHERHRARSVVPTNTFATYVSFVTGLPFLVPAAINPGLDPVVNSTGVIARQRRSYGQWSPQVSLTWSPRAEVALYGTWSRGFKSGGFNLLGTGAATDLFINNVLVTNVGIEDNFTKERTDTFEGGARIALLDGRITLHGAGYHVRVRNLQFTELLAGPFGMLRAVDNVDRARTSGAEIGATVEILPGVTIAGGGSTLTSRIKAMAARPDAVGNRVPYAANYTVHGSAQVVRAVMGEIRAFGRFDVAAVGPTNFHVIQCQSRSTLMGAAGNYCGTRRSAFATMDLRAGAMGDHWSITAFAKNLTNEHHVQDAITVPELGISIVRPAALRRVGVELSYRY